MRAKVQNLKGHYSWALTNSAMFCSLEMHKVCFWLCLCHAPCSEPTLQSRANVMMRGVWRFEDAESSERGQWNFIFSTFPINNHHDWCQRHAFKMHTLFNLSKANFQQQIEVDKWIKILEQTDFLFNQIWSFTLKFLYLIGISYIDIPCSKQSRPQYENYYMIQVKNVKQRLLHAGMVFRKNSLQNRIPISPSNQSNPI